MTKIKARGIALGISVLVGDSLLSLSFSGNLLDDLLGIGLALAFAACSAFFFRWLYGKGFGKAVFIVLLTVSAFYTLYSFSRFASPIMLKSNNIVIRR